MAEIVDFKDNKNNVKEILQDVLKQAKEAKEICIFIKDKNNDITLYYSNSLTMQDKSYFATMLQHDIFNALDLEAEVSFEPDM